MSIKATISRGVTAEFQTHHRGCAPDYRGLTAPFSESFPVPAGITAVTAALPRWQLPCHSLPATPTSWHGG